MTAKEVERNIALLPRAIFHIPNIGRFSVCLIFGPITFRTTEHIGIGTAIYIERNVTFDNVSQVGAAIEIADLNIATFEVGHHITVDIRFIGATERLVNQERGTLLVEGKVNLVHITVLVVAAENLTEQAAFDFRCGLAINIGTGVIVGARRIRSCVDTFIICVQIGIIVIMRLAVAVAAAKDAVEATSFNDDLGVGRDFLIALGIWIGVKNSHISCVAATIDGLYGILGTSVNVDRGAFSRCSRNVRSLVAATVY